jgi:hypothetical protein
MCWGAEYESFILGARWKTGQMAIDCFLRAASVLSTYFFTKLV